MTDVTWLENSLKCLPSLGSHSVSNPSLLQKGHAVLQLFHVSNTRSRPRFGYPNALLKCRSRPCEIIHPFGYLAHAKLHAQFVAKVTAVALEHAIVVAVPLARKLLQKQENI